MPFFLRVPKIILFSQKNPKKQPRRGSPQPCAGEGKAFPLKNNVVGQLFAMLVRRFCLAKFLFCAVFVCGASFFAFSQNSVGFEGLSAEGNLASYNASALRSLRLATGYVDKGQWGAAFSVAELGLAYDESVADLYYIQALSLAMRGGPPATIISLLEVSLGAGTVWHDYDGDASRLLLAEMYIETARADEALAVLDKMLVDFGQDAFLLRANAHYALGAIHEARFFVEDGARQYPYDSRFALLFFKYEYVRQMEYEYAKLRNLTTSSLSANALGYNFEVGEELLTEDVFRNAELERLAVFFISRAEELSMDNPDVLLFASAFSAYDEEKIRLLQAWNALGDTNPWYGVYALNAGLMDEEVAFRYMVPFFSSNVEYYCLKAFVSLVQGDSVKEQLRVYFADYAGSIDFDFNADLIMDMAVFYERGRPSKIEYDENQDGFLSWTIDCDYGVPFKIAIPDEKSAEYGVWPAMERVTVTVGGDDGIIYDLVADTVFWSPIQFIRDPVLEIQGETVLYIPVLDVNAGRFPDDVLFNSAFEIDVKTSEYDKSWVRFTLLDGIVKNAVYTDAGIPYAYGHFEDGFLQYREVDNDRDGDYELVELYEYDPQNAYRFQSEEDEVALCNRIFGFDEMVRGVYLHKVCADLDGDGFGEFTEEYVPDGGYIASWDTDGDGNWGTQFIQNADKDKQEVRYIHPVSKKTISIQIESGIPVFANGQPVIRDPVVDFYWLGEYPGPSYAEKMIAVLNQIDASGVIVTVTDLLWIESEDRVIRILGVKNGDMYFGEFFYE